MKKIFNKTIVLIFFLITACAETLDDVKKGLGGGKKKSTDEFLVKKKDPLVLPPKWEDLPVPGQGLDINEGIEEVIDIEELIQLGKDQKKITNIEPGSSAEDSILKQIKQK